MPTLKKKDITMTTASQPISPIHVAIISWHGKAAAAAEIAAALVGKADRVSVIYSNHDESDESGPGHWIKVPDSFFYGKKFSTSLLATNENEFLLQIQADVSCQDFGSLVAQLRLAQRRFPDLGVWTTDVDWTFWTRKITEVAPIEGTVYARIAHCDGILWAISPKVVSRMRELDYVRNNLGWGLEGAAVAFSWMTGLDAIRDTSIKVIHPKGSGYDPSPAEAQMAAFMAQLTEAERNFRMILEGSCESRMPWSEIIYRRLFKRVPRIQGQ